LSELTEFESNVRSRKTTGLQIAQSAAVKGAGFLDLGVERAFLVETEATAGKEMLRRISAMVAGF
jgi:hypothetical protein